MSHRSAIARAALAGLLACAAAQAGIGDPQLRTDHPWYPGELAMSTFSRLFATQSEQYVRATGLSTDSDEQKALASWFWRNTHFAHGEAGTHDLWGRGFQEGDVRNREYWTGLFSHGFALCGDTHAQWSAEMEYLLGHARGRCAGMAGHNAFEVWLTGGAYGTGRWALLDHDLSTAIFDEDGQRLLSGAEVQRNWQQWVQREFKPERQRGWLVCGLHPGDGASYAEYHTAEYLAGYAGPPPMVHLRRGEVFRRYFEPGLESGSEYVFWGRNYNAGGIPGPERNHTWVNEPEGMHRSVSGPDARPGKMRFANAVFTYTPDFKSGDYREGVIEESARHVTFEFNSPYVIAATPPNAKEWGIYENGCRNGLVVSGGAACEVSVSVDAGQSWSEPTTLAGRLDLTDAVKGRRGYWLRIGAGAEALKDSGLAIRTVCQANPAVLPRLIDGGTLVRHASSGQATWSAGPERPHAQAHVVAGAFDSPAVTLKVRAPRGGKLAAIHAAAHIASGNPPSTNIVYRIDASLDAGASWQPVVSDWRIARRGEEPKDFWSQSFCYGSADIPGSATEALVRFSNSGSRAILRAEAHAIFQTGEQDPARVEYCWTDDAGEHRAAHVFDRADSSAWRVPSGREVRTRWVEIQPLGRR